MDNVNSTSSPSSSILSEYEVREAVQPDGIEEELYPGSRTPPPPPRVLFRTGRRVENQQATPIPSVVSELLRPRTSSPIPPTSDNISEGLNNQAEPASAESSLISFHTPVDLSLPRSPPSDISSPGDRQTGDSRSPTPPPAEQLPAEPAQTGSDKEIEDLIGESDNESSLPGNWTPTKYPNLRANNSGDKDSLLEEILAKYSPVPSEEDKIVDISNDSDDILILCPTTKDQALCASHLVTDLTRGNLANPVKVTVTAAPAPPQVGRHSLPPVVQRLPPAKPVRKRITAPAASPPPVKSRLAEISAGSVETPPLDSRIRKSLPVVLTTASSRLHPLVNRNSISSSQEKRKFTEKRPTLSELRSFAVEIKNQLRTLGYYVPQYPQDSLDPFPDRIVVDRKDLSVTEKDLSIPVSADTKSLVVAVTAALIAPPCAKVTCQEVYSSALNLTKAHESLRQTQEKTQTLAKDSLSQLEYLREEREGLIQSLQLANNKAEQVLKTCEDAVKNYTRCLQELTASKGVIDQQDQNLVFFRSKYYEFKNKFERVLEDEYIQAANKARKDKAARELQKRNSEKDRLTRRKESKARHSERKRARRSCPVPSCTSSHGYQDHCNESDVEIDVTSISDFSPDYSPKRKVALTK